MPVFPQLYPKSNCDPRSKWKRPTPGWTRDTRVSTSTVYERDTNCNVPWNDIDISLYRVYMYFFDDPRFLSHRKCIGVYIIDAPFRFVSIGCLDWSGNYRKKYVSFPGIASGVWDKSRDPSKRRDSKRTKNYPFLCTTISREPEVVSGWTKKRFKEQDPALLTIAHSLTGSRCSRSWSDSKFFQF